MQNESPLQRCSAVTGFGLLALLLVDVGHRADAMVVEVVPTVFLLLASLAVVARAVAGHLLEPAELLSVVLTGRTGLGVHFDPPTFHIST